MQAHPGARNLLRDQRSYVLISSPKRLVARKANDSGSGFSETPLNFEALRVQTRRLQALEDYKKFLAIMDSDKGPQGPDGLLEGVVLIASHRHPNLTVEHVKQKLDDLASRVALPSERYVMRTVKELNKFFFEEMGFKGAEDYYRPGNSCINEVLTSRRGIPISLSLAYMEVAKRLGVPFIGLNIPSHFLIRPATDEVQFFVDCFAGEIVFLQEAEEKLGKLWGGAKVVLDPNWLSLDAAIPPRMFLARWINNLKTVYSVTVEPENAYLMSLYLQATLPNQVQELRDQGIFLYRLGRVPEALESLEAYVATGPKDADTVARMIRSIKEGRSMQKGQGGGGGGAGGVGTSGGGAAPAPPSVGGGARSSSGAIWWGGNWPGLTSTSKGGGLSSGGNAGPAGTSGSGTGQPDAGRGGSSAASASGAASGGPSPTARGSEDSGLSSSQGGAARGGAEGASGVGRGVPGSGTGTGGGAGLSDSHSESDSAAAGGSGEVEGPGEGKAGPIA